jgi:hypothetical protein
VVLRQFFESARVRARKAITLAVNPALKFWRIVDMKTVEERTAIKLNGLGEVTCGDRILKLDDVATNVIGIQ